MLLGKSWWFAIMSPAGRLDDDNDDDDNFGNVDFDFQFL